MSTTTTKPRRPLTEAERKARAQRAAERWAAALNRAENGNSLANYATIFAGFMAQGIDEAYQFVIDGQPFWARVRNGELRTGLDQVEGPAVTVTASRTSFLAVAAGEVELEDAVAAGEYHVDGDPEALRRAATIFPSHTDPLENHHEPAA